MKKLFNILFALPLLLTVACSNDNDIPNVSLSIETSGCWKVDNDSRIYVVEGDTMMINGIYVQSLDGKKAAITSATYYLNTIPYSEPFMAPYSTIIPSAYLKEGNNLLAASMIIGVVDYPIQSALAEWTVTLVPTKEDLPDGAVYTPLPEEDSPSGPGPVE